MRLTRRHLAWIGAAIVAVIVVVNVTRSGTNGDGGTTTAASTVDAQADVDDPAADRAATARLREDFRFNFGQPDYRTTWYTPPATLRVKSGTIEAHTDWYYDDEGKQIGLDLCRALYLNYVAANDADYGAEDVIVYSANELILAHAYSFSGECKAG